MMRVRPRTHAPGTSMTKFNPYAADLLRAYREKRNRKRKESYKKKKYNRVHGKFGGRQ